MGYTTQYSGRLKISTEMTIPLLKKLRKVLATRDARELSPYRHLSYIPVVLAEDMDHLIACEEDNQPMVEAINFIITQMREEFPDFALIGQLQARGEERDDNWTLVIGEDGLAREVKDDGIAFDKVADHLNGLSPGMRLTFIGGMQSLTRFCWTCGHDKGQRRVRKPYEMGMDFEEYCACSK